jgi:DNA-binding IscR family transcriptional regulator
MDKVKFLKGPSLKAFARKKAAELGQDGKGVKLVELIRLVQEKEGYVDCFRREKYCGQIDCCWQASCGAKMKTAEI